MSYVQSTSKQNTRYDDKKMHLYIISLSQEYFSMMTGVHGRTGPVSLGGGGGVVRSLDRIFYSVLARIQVVFPNDVYFGPKIAILKNSIFRRATVQPPPRTLMTMSWMIHCNCRVYLSNRNRLNALNNSCTKNNPNDWFLFLQFKCYSFMFNEVDVCFSIKPFENKIEKIRLQYASSFLWLERFNDHHYHIINIMCLLFQSGAYRRTEIKVILAWVSLSKPILSLESFQKTDNTALFLSCYWRHSIPPQKHCTCATDY